MLRAKQLVSFACIVAVVACKPNSVLEAEAKGDVSWLASEGSPESVAALGRLADKDDRAVAELTQLAAAPESDAGRGPLDVYLAAWAATERKAGWGSALLQRGLGNPSSAPKAAEAMKRGAPELDAFLPALDSAVRAGCAAPCAGAIASVATSGVADVVKHRLEDATTRAAMCTGLSSRETSSAAAAVFTQVAPEARDAASCVDAASPLAAHNDAVLQWLGASGEGALLGSASRGELLPCARLQQAWEAAFHGRSKESYGSVAIPLVAAVKRCPKEMDGVLAAALVSDANAQALAVSGIDPLGPAIHDLKATCAALAGVGHTPRASALTRSRAAEALAKCPRR